jgi:Domain of unknown function (DUF4261)
MADPPSIDIAIPGPWASRTDKTLASFGMRQFGLPDAAAPFSDLDAAWVIATFNLYQLTERPVFQDGQTFSMDQDSPRYRLQHSPDTRYEPGHPYLNPQGVWDLMPLLSAKSRR